MADVPAAPTFESVFRSQYPSVLRVIRALGVTEAEAEDVAQSVFLVVHRRLGDYDPARPLRSWLFGITRRVVKDHHRSRARAAARENARHKVEHEPEDPMAFAQRREAISLVEQILSGMKEEWRLVFVLTDIEGYTAPEIAETLEWKLPTVYTRLRRARLYFEEERKRLTQKDAAHG